MKKYFLLFIATLIQPVGLVSGTEQDEGMQDVVLTWKTEAIAESEEVVRLFYKDSAGDRGGLFLHAVSNIGNIAEIISSCKQSNEMNLRQSLDQEFNTSFFSYIRHDIPVFTFGERTIGLLVDWSRIFTHIGVHEEISEPVKVKEPQNTVTLSKAPVSAPALPPLTKNVIQQQPKQQPVIDEKIIFIENKIRYFPDIHLGDQRASKYEKNQKLLGDLGIDTFGNAASGLDKMASLFRNRAIQSKKPDWYKQWNEIRTSAIPCDAYVGIFYIDNRGTRNKNSVANETKGFSVSDSGFKFTVKVNKKLFADWSKNISDTLPVFRYTVNPKNSEGNGQSVADLQLEQIIGLDD